MTIDRYIVEAAGVRLEISAPRADIVRVRAGRAALPEDASWAVAPEARARVVPLELTETPAQAIISTGRLEIRLDMQTLDLAVADSDGRVVLADAPGEALAFAGEGFRLGKALTPGRTIFGLGDKTGPLDRRGGRFEFWNTDAFEFGLDADPLYKTIPFLLGLEPDEPTFGLLIDNTWRSFIDVGRTNPRVLTFEAKGGSVDYYVLSGATPNAILEAFAYLTGTPPLPPAWSLGFQQSRWSYMSQGEVQAIADRLRAEAIPADVLYLDIDFQDRNRPFTVNRETFPDMPGLCRRLDRQGLKVVAITDLHIAAAPDEGYAPYDSGAALGAFVRNPDGGFYVGEVWPGPSVFPDFSRQTVRRWWGGLYRPLLGAGVAGFWNDMNEPAILKAPSKTMPEDVVHRIEEPGFAARDAAHAEMHNVLGSLNAKATYEGLLALEPDRRPFVLTRAAYTGGHRYAATWTGDNVSTWEHLALSIRQLISLGLSGFALVGADVGGFGGTAPSPELLTRWIQIGAFTPFFRLHCKTGKPAQEIWVHGPEHTAVRRRAIEERYRLLPYLYALAEEASRTGAPMLRPVFLEFPDQSTAASEGQFMLGPDILITPSPYADPETPYLVRLPGRGWYDYWTGERVEGDECWERPSLERLAVFVRPGSVIPRQPVVQSTAQTPSGPLQIAVYPGAERTGRLYFDDGISFAYRRGEYLRQMISGRSDAIVLGPRQGHWPPWWTEIEVSLHGQTGGALTITRADPSMGGRVEFQP
ncbi:MAG TPA: glycoside hydrolase family 31 protein [Caulobacteraceae bacterium]|nr:glycoside hydrolase family 31 protein [Caulobacteraceae bacterium]